MSGDRFSVEFMAHSSIKFKAGDCCVLCDPWYMGTAFNDGWALSPAPDLDRFDLSDVTHLWISHEHPDHMHFPTLKWLAERLDPAKVTFLFQDTNSKKVFDALGKFGFRTCVAMKHLDRLRISPDLELFVYAHRHLDSALGVIWRGRNTLLNVNDAELNDADCRYITDRYGTFPLLFNQFSMAGFEGDDDDGKLDELGSQILDNIVAQHRNLGARYTVPFASYMYFCCSDNHVLNRHRNAIADVLETFEENGIAPVLMAPQGEGLSFAENEVEPMTIAPEFIARGRAWYEDFYRDEQIPIRDPERNRIEFDDVRESFAKRTRAWKARTFGFIYRRLGRVRTWITDLETGVVLDFGSCEMVADASVTAENADLLIGSQPLDFAFRFPFGVQTLGVSGRYRFREHVPPNWRWTRVISSLHNADVHLGFGSLFSLPTLKWLWQRRTGLIGQIRQQIRRFRKIGA